MMDSAEEDPVLHILLTRFNVMSGGKEEQIRKRDTWLTERFGLFEQFCWPSVKAQSRDDFKWLVFFDAATPDVFKARIENSLRLKQFQPVYVNNWSTEVVAAAIREHISPGHRFLLTSRLDNDDGLHRDFISVLRKSMSQESGFYNFPDGLIYRSASLYEHVDYANAFASYIEPIADFKTVWHMQHQTINQQGATCQIPLKAAWLQVVHGANVSNRVHGQRITATVWPSGYEHLRNLRLTHDGSLGLVVERLLFFPARNLRDLAARKIKAALQRFRPGKGKV